MGRMTRHRLPSTRVFGVLLAAKAAGLLSRLLGRGSGEKPCPED